MMRTSAVFSVVAVSCLMLVDSVFADQPQTKRTHHTAQNTCGPNGCSSQPTTGLPVICSNGHCSYGHSATVPTGITSVRNPTALPSPQRSAKIKWHRDLRKAAQVAKAEKKPLMVNVSADWCHYCVKMKSETYTRRPIIDQINRQYVPVMLDADTNRNIVELLGVESLPAIVVISNDAIVLSKTTGYKSATQLSTHLNQVVMNKKLNRTEPASRNRR